MRFTFVAPHALWPGRDDAFTDVRLGDVLDEINAVANPWWFYSDAMSYFRPPLGAAFGLLPQNAMRYPRMWIGALDEASRFGQGYFEVGGAPPILAQLLGKQTGTKEPDARAAWEYIWNVGTYRTPMGAIGSGPRANVAKLWLEWKGEMAAEEARKKAEAERLSKEEADRLAEEARRREMAAQGDTAQKMVAERGVEAMKHTQTAVEKRIKELSELPGLSGVNILDSLKNLSLAVKITLGAAVVIGGIVVIRFLTR